MTASIYQHFSDAEQPFVKQVLSLKNEIIQNGRVKTTDFLTKREQDIVTNIIGAQATIHWYGGYEAAERKTATIAPLDMYADKDRTEKLRISYNQKFATIKHGDVLGSLLGLGIERKVFGDILMGEKCIQIIVLARIVPFIMQHLVKIGKTSVSVEKDETEIEKITEAYKEVTVFVKSLRLDSLVAHVTGISREKAQQLLEKQYIQQNWKVITNPNTVYQEEDVISVRQFGRVYIRKIDSIKNNTKYKVFVEKTS